MACQRHLIFDFSFVSMFLFFLCSLFPFPFPLPFFILCFYPFREKCVRLLTGTLCSPLPLLNRLLSPPLNASKYALHSCHVPLYMSIHVFPVHYFSLPSFIFSHFLCPSVSIGLILNLLSMLLIL